MPRLCLQVVPVAPCTVTRSLGPKVAHEKRPLTSLSATAFAAGPESKTAMGKIAQQKSNKKKCYKNLHKIRADRITRIGNRVEVLRVFLLFVRGLQARKRRSKRTKELATKEQKRKEKTKVKKSRIFSIGWRDVGGSFLGAFHPLHLEGGRENGR